MVLWQPEFGLRRNAGTLVFGVLLSVLACANVEGQDGQRARDHGIAPGVLPVGPLNAITDVEGVQVGHMTKTDGTRVNTGATVIFPHGGNLYQEKVPAGFAVLNGFGKFAGSTQIAELGEIETPIVLTNTLAVTTGMEAALEWTLNMPGNEQIRSANAVVGETNDGFLNDIRARELTVPDILQAFENASSGPVLEGAVGAGRGTRSFGWKGGIGTSSRRLPDGIGGYTVGVLVQTNYGGILEILGVPVGRELGQYYLKDVVDNGDADGSVIIVVATDAPMTSRQLNRLARRSLLAIGRSGSPATHGSGDYAIAFSTASGARLLHSRQSQQGTVPLAVLHDSNLSPLFQATVEATEEAIYNALFAAESVDGHRGRVERLPVEDVLAILRKYGRLKE